MSGNVRLFDAADRPLVTANNRLVVDIGALAGSAPTVSGGRLAVDVFSGGVAVLLDESGRVATLPQNATAIPAGTVTHLASSGLQISWGVAGARRFLRAAGMTTVAGQFVQLHNTAAQPAPGAIPLYVQNTSAGGTSGPNWVIDFTQLGGLSLSTGIWIAASSTAGTFTASAAVNIIGVLSYI